MARTYLAVETRTNKILGQLPLTVSGDLSRVIGNYSASSFTLPVTDPKTPSNWEELIEPQLMSIWVIDSFFKEPLWAGQIVDIPRSNTEEVTLDCITFEGHLTHRFMNTSVYNDMDPMLILRKIIEDHVEHMDSDPDHPELGSWLTGIGMEFDIPMSGLERSVDYKEYNDTTVFSAVEDWAKSNNFEWTIEPRFVDPETRSGLRKVFTARYKYLGTVTDHPNHEFLMSGIQTSERSGDLGGNVVSYSYSEATNGDGYATHIVAIGEGSGVLRTRSAQIRNSVQEAKGYPRVMVRKNFSGVKFTEDAQYLGDAEAEQLFKHHDIITIDAHDNGATNLQSMQLGDSALVTIKTLSLKTKKVMRLVGWSVGNESDAFSPTLAELGADPTKFKRAVDPMAPSEDDSSTGTNPNENGVYVPSPDGGGWGISPDGPVTWDPDGNMTSGDWGGSGSSGTITRRIVKSYDDASKRAVLRDIDSSSEEEYVGHNASGFDLVPGDYVATGDTTEEDSETKIIVGRERHEFPEPTQYQKWRVHEGFPVNVKSYNMAIGYSFIDVGNVFNKGASAVIVNGASEPSKNNWFNKKFGNVGKMSVPSGHTSIGTDAGRNVIVVDNTFCDAGAGYRCFMDASHRPRLFRSDPTVVGGWRYMEGMPESPTAFNIGGDWSVKSASKEVYSRPTIVSGRVTNNKFVDLGPIPRANKYYGIEVEFIVWTPDSNQLTMSPVHTYPTVISVYSPYTVPVDVPQSASFNIDTYANGSHIFFKASMNSVSGAGTGASGNNLFYTDLSDPTMELHDFDSIDSYLGPNIIPRVSSDGMMFGMGLVNIDGVQSAPHLFFRRITDDTSYNIMVDNQPARGDVCAERDGLSERFYVAARTIQYEDFENTIESSVTANVWEVYSNGSIGLVETMSGDTGSNRVTMPIQMPDGSITLMIDRSQSQYVYGFMPDDLPTTGTGMSDPYAPITQSTEPTP